MLLLNGIQHKIVMRTFAKRPIFTITQFFLTIIRKKEEKKYVDYVPWTLSPNIEEF